MSTLDRPSVLIACATKHGATAEIASHIADVLRVSGFEACVHDLKTDHDDIPNRAGVVIGSAVYAGHWRKEARNFIDRHQRELQRVPVWLFSSGPLGEPPTSEEEPLEVHDLVEATGALGHRIFDGRLDKNQLNLAEKAMVLAAKAPYGDFRDWYKIGAWASEIASYLRLRTGMEPHHPRGQLRQRET